MTHQEYLDNFDQYAKDVYGSNIPSSSEGRKGGLLTMESYLEDIPGKLSTINDKLTKEGNHILSEASRDNSINSQKLKEGLLAIVNKNHNEWMESHKPKKRP